MGSPDVESLDRGSIIEIPDQDVIFGGRVKGEKGKAAHDVRSAVRFALDGYEERDPLFRTVASIDDCNNTSGEIAGGYYAKKSECVNNRAKSVISQLEARRTRHCNTEISGSTQTGGVKIDIGGVLDGVFNKKKKKLPKLPSF